ncbi:mitochondrial amidoxime reducing component 2-like [Penaeus chinensis]|uniref:mitochondrial amidoxime reducing component 2-like n=1 Tax=Penaeus chinensis TaxID=139456 RepID=UPI001FB6CA77|nr:mitochondrial amidoxime reducing component 2-like [Penaeus chinensis]
MPRAPAHPYSPGYKREILAYKIVVAASGGERTAERGRENGRLERKQGKQTGFVSMRVPTSTAMGVGIGVGVGALAGLWAWRRHTPREPPNTWEEVGVISALTLYPLKSGRGVAVEEGRATEFGLASGPARDRSFMVMTSEGTFITCRQVGRLATVVIKIEDQRVTLSADGEGEVTFDLQQVMGDVKVNQVRIWNQRTRGVDCGDAVADWLSQLLYKGETRVRLLYQGGLVKDRPARKPDYFEFPQFRASDRVREAAEPVVVVGGGEENISLCMRKNCMLCHYLLLASSYYWLIFIFLPSHLYWFYLLCQILSLFFLSFLFPLFGSLPISQFTSSTGK